MRKFKVPTREEVSPGKQIIFDNLSTALGFVPNIYAAMSWSENGLERYLAYQNAKSSLSAREKEAVNLVVSEVHGCRYCQSAHTVVAAKHGFSAEQILELRSGGSSDAKLNVLVTLAKEIAEYRGRVKSSTLNEFYEVGYTDGNLVDLVLKISEIAVSNFLHNITQLPIDFPLAAPLNRVME